MTLLGIRLIWTLVSICFSKSQVTVVPLGPGRAAGTLRGPSRVPEGASGLRVPAFLQCLPLQTGLCHPWLQLLGQYRPPPVPASREATFCLCRGALRLQILQSRGQITVATIC